MDNYLASMKEHVNNSCSMLAELSTYADTRPLTKIELSSCERQLQVLTEAAIGIAKQLLKALAKPIPNQAYQAFTELYSMQLISEVELKQWKSIIGLRNSLVHDYLSINHDILLQILKEQKYTFIQQFIDYCITKWPTHKDFA